MVIAYPVTNSTLMINSKQSNYMPMIKCKQLSQLIIILSNISINNEVLYNIKFLWHGYIIMIVKR